MQIRLTDKAVRQYNTLPKALQHKADTQFDCHVEDFRHPSLNAKKYQGSDEVWQGRIDKRWRFYFHIIEPYYIIISVINHLK